MADNLEITQGSGTKVSTEEVTTLNGGAVDAQHVQRVVPAIRTADGTAVDVTSSAPMPVSDGGGTLTVDGTVAVTGTFWQATQPVSIATLPALAAGTNGIGKLTANTGVTIGAVEIAASQTLATVTNLSQLGGQAIAMGTGVRTGGTQRVTIATDDLVPVTGTVTANLSATDNAVLDDIAAALDGTLAISAVALPLAPGAAEAAKQDTTNGYLATLATAPVAHDAVNTEEGVNISGEAKAGLSGVTLVAAGDKTDAFFGLDGAQYVNTVPLADLVSGLAPITDGSSTSVISAQGAGIKTYVQSVVIANSSATPVTVDLRDGTGGSVKATFPVPAGAGVVFSFGSCPIAFTANTAVAADPSAAASTVTVTLSGFKSKI